MTLLLLKKLEKIATANNLAKRNWTHDLICKLCGVDLETPTSPVQRLHIREASMVLSKTMARFGSTLFSGNEWIAA